MCLGCRTSTSISELIESRFTFSYVNDTLEINIRSLDEEYLYAYYLSVTNLTGILISSLVDLKVQLK